MKFFSIPVLRLRMVHGSDNNKTKQQPITAGLEHDPTSMERRSPMFDSFYLL
jgi:hypothetical protein